MKTVKVVVALLGIGTNVAAAQTLTTSAPITNITYDITADGQRILAITQDGEAARTPLTLVLNWPALVKE